MYLGESIARFYARIIPSLISWCYCALYTESHVYALITSSDGLYWSNIEMLFRFVEAFIESVFVEGATTYIIAYPFLVPSVWLYRVCGWYVG